MGNRSSNAGNLRHWLAFGVAATLCVASAAPVTAGPMNYAGQVLYPLNLPDGMPGGLGISVAAGQTAGWNGVTALLWSANGMVTDLNPPGFNQSSVNATNGTQQVGQAENDALLWSGTPGSMVNLSPAGYAASLALGLGGDQQVGEGYTNSSLTITHALLWTGSAASVVDLNPAGFTSSTAWNTDGTQQVGDAGDKAFLWSSTAATAVDLNPAGFGGSIAYGISGKQQVGYGEGSNTSDRQHALLWTGTAASAVDLNPTGLAGIYDSVALATNGSEQVGVGNTNNGFPNIGVALAWFGTAASAVDLQSLLPAAGTWTDSSAMTIDSAGNIYGVADGTFGGETGEFAVEWSSVPEPGTRALMGLAGGMLLRRRRMGAVRRLECEIVR